jgi:hypothetical protein
MERERPDWFDRSMTAVLDQAGLLMRAQGPRELDQATAELLGAELHRVVRDESRGMWFDWLFEEIAGAATTRVRDGASRSDEAWEASWRLLHGLTSIGSPPLRWVAHQALARARKALPAGARARQPGWLPLLPKLGATGEVWEMHDVYGTRFAVIAGFRYPSGTDPSVYLFDIDTCDIVRLASAGVFDGVGEAASAWRKLIGAAAGEAQPTSVDTPERMYCLAHLGSHERHVEGDEPRAVLDNWFRLDRRRYELADALSRRGMPLPAAKSLYHGLDTTPMTTAFTNWYLRCHDIAPDAEALEALAQQWLEGAIPGTEHSASPHRVQSQLNLINDWDPVDPVTVDAKALLPEWVRWNCAEAGLSAQLTDRSVAVARGEYTSTGHLEGDRGVGVTGGRRA